MRAPTVIDPIGSKTQRYARLGAEIAAVLEGENDRTARMATVAAMLSAEFEAFFWTGFYCVDPARTRELVVGPYQGTLGCLRIAFGRGVCGAAAERRETLIVPDVDAFAGTSPATPAPEARSPSRSLMRQRR